MPKVKYDDITFDSELEVEYYKYLQGLKMQGKVITYNYHPAVPIQITKNNSYTPDFVVFYPNSKIEIIETKGYNPYSKMRDDMIHQVMLSKTEQQLRDWISLNYRFNFYGNSVNCNSYRVEYKKVKYLKAYGFVDWDFKNPNTIANKRKEKIQEQTTEIKELRDFKNNAIRYFTYHLKIVNNEKLTKPQREWYYKYIEEIKKLVNN